MNASSKVLILQGIIFLLSASLSFSHLFIGTLCTAFLAIILRILAATKKIKPLTRILIRIISIAGLMLLIIEGIGHGQIGEFFINLLILGTSLKFLEYQNQRDTYINICALSFMSILPLIFNYESYTALYLLTMPCLILWSFVAAVVDQKIKADLLVILKTVLPAIPIAAALFFAIPRFHGFWSMPGQNNSEQAMTGLSEEMDPNNISSLLKSSRIAARVTFNGQMPKDLYFRAVTYSEYDGKWIQNKIRRNTIDYLSQFHYIEDQRNRNILQGNKTLTYDIMLEPSGNVFIPSLYPSYSPEHHIFFLYDQTYVSAEPLNNRELFHMEWHENPNGIIDRRVDPGDYLFIPWGHNLKTRKLVEKLTEGIEEPKEKVQILLDYFSKGFTYSTNPGPFTSDNADDFLFNKKEGFCVHFAGTYALMLRMAGIPSRIAAGYAGGQLSPDGKYLILQDKDAHAWVEAYIDDKWISLDPTLLASPQFFSIKRDGEQNNYTYNKISSFFSSVAETINYTWSRFILNFSVEEQSNFFKGNIGNILIFTLSGMLLTVMLAFLTMYRRQKKEPAELVILRKALKFLGKNGYRIKHYETVEKFAQRIKTSIYSNTFKIIKEHFNALHYMKLENKAERIKHLQAMIAALKNLKKIKVKNSL